MRVYLAANFAMRHLLRSHVVPFLEENGHSVVADWITNEKHSLEGNSRESAVQDLKDVEESGALIMFAEQYGLTPGAGKYVEMGYAIRAGKMVIVVGEGRCVFYHLPTVRRAKTIEEALVYLGGKIGKYQEKGL